MLMQRPKLTRVITFRVTEEEWFGIQRAERSVESRRTNGAG